MNRLSSIFHSLSLGLFLTIQFISGTTYGATNTVSVLGSWVQGTTHAKEAGTNRALVVLIYGEGSANIAASTVSYGGQAMTLLAEKAYSNGTYSYTGTFILNESKVAASSSGTISVSWSKAPTAGYSLASVFLSNVNQSSLFGASAVTGLVGTTITSGQSVNAAGDMILVAGTAGTNGTYTINNGFTRGIPETSTSFGDITAAFKIGTGALVTPSLTHSINQRQTLVSFVVKVALPVSSVNNKDIGSVGLVGSASNSSGIYTLKGSGADINGTSDAFQFLYGTLNGDGEVTARIDNVTETNAQTRVGIMIRNDLNANSVNGFFYLYPTKGSAFQYRTTAGAGTNTTWDEIPPNRNDNWEYPTRYRTRYLRPSKWLKATKVGNTVTIYSSDDGMCWNIRWRQDLTFSGTTSYAGVALTSHDNTKLATATISSFSFTSGTPAEVNTACDRTKVDGDLTPPTNWLVKPFKAGMADTWAISSINPDNTNKMPTTCLELDGTAHLENGNFVPAHRRYQDDDPICPADSLTNPWAFLGYAFNTGAWSQSMPGPFGVAGIGPVGTTVTGNTLWLRKEISLTSAGLSQLVFWGRWSNAVSIYVNGVLATNIYDSQTSDRYYYLGMNDKARAALKPGVNVIAARVDRVKYGSGLYTDFGVALHPILGKYPHTISATVPGSDNAKLAQIFADYTQEMGTLGGAFAIRSGSNAVEVHSLGWKDISLAAPMPADPILRLASVDKRVTEAAIVKLYKDRLLNPDAKVFGQVLPAIQPPLGQSFGANVLDITVDQLRQHTSGISGIGGGQAWQDEVGFIFDVPASQITKTHLARILAAQNTQFTPGSKFDYSSNGYFLLRYIAEVVTGKSIASYLATDMGAQNIVVAYERLAGRSPSEGGYGTIAAETRSRWFELEEYMALSASASGLGKFFLDYAPQYERSGNNFIGQSGGQGGSMSGTRAGAGADLVARTAEAEIWNSDMPGSNRFSDRCAVIKYHRFPGSCDPRGKLNQPFRINNFWKLEQYVNIEPVTPGGPTKLKSDTIKDSWESAKWLFQPISVGQETYYILQNSWVRDQALQFKNGAVISAGWVDTDPTAQWKLWDMGSYFRIESRAVPGSFLNIENGFLQATNLTDGAWSTRWYLCN